MFCHAMDCKHTRLPSHFQFPGVCPNWCLLSWWCYPTISSYATLFSSCPQSFPALGSFPLSWLFKSGDQSIGASISASVLPVNIQCGYPIWLTGLTFLLSQGLVRVFSNTTIQKHQFFGTQPYGPALTSYMTTGITIALTIGTFVSKVMSLLFNILSRIVIAFLPINKYLFISWLQLPSTVIFEPKKIKISHRSSFTPSICHEVMGPDDMIFVFRKLSFKPAFSLSSFTFIKEAL